MLFPVMTTRANLDAHQRRRLCAEAACDERTLARYLKRQLVRSESAFRIEQAAKALGLTVATTPGEKT